MFVFADELTADEVNAIRNLRLGTLDYSPLQADSLFDLFDGTTTGPIVVGTQLWSTTTGLSGSPGELFDLGSGAYNLVLDSGSGNGLTASVVPEPSTALLVMGGLAGMAARRRRAARLN